MSPLARVSPWLVGLVVAMVGAWGLDARDLAGDEIHMLVGDPLWITERALDPRSGFVGHLPWSYWLRWMSLSVFGQHAWAWRLHALVGATIAAGLGTRLAGLRLGTGSGVAVGLLIGLGPVLAFHAQDSSNYAWSAATGALVLGGLWGLTEGRRGSATWLGAGLLLGGLNDFYFGFLGVTALGASLVLLRREPMIRRALVGAWLPALLVLLPAAAVFVFRLTESHTGGVVDVHSDPPAPSALPWMVDIVWRVLRRFFCGMQAGVAAGRIDAPWEVVAPVITGVGTMVAAARGRGRVPAVALGATLGLLLLAGLTFRGVAGRTLPHEPRAFLTLLPALACVLVSGLARLPRPLALVGGGLLALGVASPTVEQVWTRSTMHRDAAAVAARTGPWLTAAGLPLRDLELVVADGRIRDRLPAVIAPMGPGVRASTHDCVPEDASLLVVIRNQPLDGPATRLACTGEAADLTAYTLIASASLGPPEHERNAASFLMPVQLEVWWPGPLPASLPSERPFRLAPTLLDGVRADTRVAVWTGPEGARAPERVVWEGPLADAPTGLALDRLDDTFRVVLTPAGRDLPAVGLFDPLRREVQSTEPGLTAPLVVGDQPSRLRPLQAPTWQVLLRVLRLLLAALSLAAAAWPGPRP